MCAKQTRQGGDTECGAEGGGELEVGGVEEDVLLRFHARLVMPSRLRLSVINLIEALSLLDCGSKRKEGRRG